MQINIKIKVINFYMLLHIKIAKTIFLYAKTYNFKKFICQCKNLRRYFQVIHRW